MKLVIRPLLERMRESPALSLPAKARAPILSAGETYDGAGENALFNRNFSSKN